LHYAGDEGVWSFLKRRAIGLKDKIKPLIIRNNSGIKESQDLAK
jgi:hypothetical protein